MATYAPEWKLIPTPYRVDPAGEIHRMVLVHKDDGVAIYWAVKELVLIKYQDGEWWTARLSGSWRTPRADVAEERLAGVAV